MTPEEEVGLPSKDWMSSRWRPMMGWMYMIVCVFDFILFPIAWSVGLASLHMPVTEWNPLTLQGAGLFHMAMGAVLGVAAWSRGQEKITAMNISSPSTTGYSNTGYSNAGYNNAGYNRGPIGGMTQQETTFYSQTPMRSATKVPQEPQPPL